MACSHFETCVRASARKLHATICEKAVDSSWEEIAEKLDAKVWPELVDLMIQGVKGGDLAAGMTQAIARCGELLSPHFPIAPDDINELRDHLVVKE